MIQTKTADQYKRPTSTHSWVDLTLIEEDDFEIARGTFSTYALKCVCCISFVIVANPCSCIYLFHRGLQF